MTRVNVIEAQKISKEYSFVDSGPGVGGTLRRLLCPTLRSRTGLKPVSLSVPAGESVGIIGPNGAGKSTLIKMLVGILRPDTGAVRILGMDPFERRQECCRRIGTVFGQRSNLWWDLPAGDTFEFVRAMYGITAVDYRTAFDELDAVFGLGELVRQPVRTLSLGQRVRCSLAAALLPRPEILFLDEPTIGLDTIAVAQLTDMLRRVNAARGTTVVITCHDLGVIEDVCSRILIVSDGSIAFDGPVEAAVRRYAGCRKVRLVFRPGGRDTVPDGAGDWALIPPGTQTPYGREWVFPDGGELPEGFLAVLQSFTRRGLADYYIEKPTLQEVILNAFR